MNAKFMFLFLFVAYALNISAMGQPFTGDEKAFRSKLTPLNLRHARSERFECITSRDGFQSVTMPGFVMSRSWPTLPPAESTSAEVNGQARYATSWDGSCEQRTLCYCCAASWLCMCGYAMGRMTPNEQYPVFKGVFGPNEIRPDYQIFAGSCCGLAALFNAPTERGGHSYIVEKMRALQRWLCQQVSLKKQ